MATKNSKGMYLVIGVIVILLALFAFYFMSSKKNLTGPLGSTKGGNVFTSIKDALSKSVSLECTFSDESGRKTTSYIKNGAIRADIVSSIADESGSVILKDNKTYFWNNKGGFVMTVKPDANTAGGNPVQSQGDSIMKDLEKYKDSCKASVVSDSLFTPPSNVKFTDLSELMKGGGLPIPSVDMKQYQNSIPQGSNPDITGNQ
jgi:hypothetical protein